MLSPETRIIISGGGTGGHIFPAIAIADALKQAIPGVSILFVGAEGRMEMEKVPAAGYEIEALWISGIQRSLTLKNLLIPLKLIHSNLKAHQIIRRFKPDAAIGVGGYASGPTIRAAALSGIPTILQEQNSYPGITNKMLAGKARKICVAYPGMEKYFPQSKLIVTGNPVRKDIANQQVSREEALKFFGLDASKPVVLAVGGSLGARTINQSLHSGLKELTDQHIQLIWQTGKNYAEQAAMAVIPFEKAGVRQFAFITRMDMAYAAADIVISRAGAIAISELCITGKPSILVPSPNVAEDHQTKNAMALVSKDAALIVKDADAPSSLVATTVDLAFNKAHQETLKKNILQLAQLNSAQRIAEVIMQCIQEHQNA
ncbi:MAG: undecaprenyldiphospho-muramoylpentapeptide beta-N-acetylglucosaminyltransferase [Lentimicrobiaceae bacterium]|nr:undecaprenyldiphospho-muramoylpentapeptide beta-N-acetylglucosaminyltransferase [Lentimicrobiaceae bacterium]MCO5266454.1 undecaprenyldiphospho-muramoylpentapeptide beta-N-acetylglucosaminyltransferase [Lentimicrobium sp.]HPG34110.1 undecaprenyldiphospho-muramoylpentapeptide beta-N-acetylglucosaminyltransferase [Lentimicrobium sp.]